MQYRLANQETWAGVRLQGLDPPFQSRSLGKVLKPGVPDWAVVRTLPGLTFEMTPEGPVASMFSCLLDRIWHRLPILSISTPLGPGVSLVHT